jgi:hypothetical protein
VGSLRRLDGGSPIALRLARRPLDRGDFGRRYHPLLFADAPGVVASDARPEGRPFDRQEGKHPTLGLSETEPCPPRTDEPGGSGSGQPGAPYEIGPEAGAIGPSAAAPIGQRIARASLVPTASRSRRRPDDRRTPGVLTTWARPRGNSVCFSTRPGARCRGRSFLHAPNIQRDRRLPLCPDRDGSRPEAGGET